jgi:tetratricopeptide (TPR) repeat protein
MATIKNYGSRVAWSIGVLFFLGVIGAALGRWMHPAADPLTEARAAYAKGEWERAADLSRRLLKTKPSDPDSLRLLARALVRLNRDATASAIYNGRLGASEMQPEDLFLAGLTIVRAGQLNLALEVWEKALKSAPDYPELLDSLAQLSFRLQHLDQSAEAARRLATQPGWEARGLLLLGAVQAQLENPKGAVDAIQKSFELDPTAKGAPVEVAHYQKLLARGLLELGRPAEAEGPLQSVLAASGRTDVDGDREAQWLLSRAYLQEGRIADASSALKRAGKYRAENPLMPEPSPYVGSARCAPCHRDEERAYEPTRHNRTFHRGADLVKLPLPDRPLPDPDDPKVSHTFAREGDKIHARTKAGDRVFNTVVEYAFGTPERYITMIGRDDQHDVRALRLSYYHTAEGSGWGRTFGSPDDVELVRGQAIVVRDGVNRCLYCHVTQSRAFRDPPPEPGAGPEAADPGIGCERCHGPGANHIAAMKVDFADRATVNAGSATAAVINTQCAQCHVVGSRAEIEKEPDNAMYVRSSGATLPFSRCYTESDGGMSCLTCHNPHRDAEKSAAFYESKCLSCHSQQQSTSTAKTRTSQQTARAPSTGRRTTCPVNPTKGCLDCHMPKIPVPVLHTSMTDHYIRVREKSKQ